MNKKSHLSLLSLYCLIFGDCLAMLFVMAANRWRVLVDRPPVIGASVSQRAAGYVFLVMAVGVLLSLLRTFIAAPKRLVLRYLYAFLIVRAIALNGVITHDARDAWELARAKARISVVSRVAVEFATTNGRVPNSLNELSLNNELKLDPWGFTLGYQKTTSGFRVFVRGAPDYVRALDISGKNLEKTVDVALRQHS